MSARRGDITASSLTWVRWNEKAAETLPALRAAIASFDPAPRGAGRAAARWLREASLNGESVAYLAVVTDPQWELVGFYALTAGEVELTGTHRERLGLAHPVQGAVLVTQIARSVRHRGVGQLLVEDAIGVARESQSQVGATVLALDPFDADTDAMWRRQFGFRRSRTEIRSTGDDGRPLRRLYLPLRDPLGKAGASPAVSQPLTADTEPLESANDR